MEPSRAPLVPSERLLLHKWATFAAMYAGYLLVVLDRKAFSFVLPAVTAELRLDKDDLGLITSSQNLAYSISKFLGGVLSDRVSPRLLFCGGLALTAVLTVGFAGFETVRAFAVIWFLQGFVQGGMWPACAKILRTWSPPAQFGTLWSALSSSMNVACTVGPLVATAAVLVAPWQRFLQTLGLLSLVVALAAFTVIVDSPTDLGYSSYSDNKDTGRPSPRGRGSWTDMLRSPFMWLVCASYLVVFMVRTAALDWAQLYLIHEAKQSTFTGSGFISALETGGFIGTIVAGYAADRLVAMSERTDARGTPRMSVVMGYVALCIVSLHCLIFTVSERSSQVWITSLGFVLGFGLYGPIALYGVMAIEAAPTHLAGMSHAIVALSANVGAVLAGLPLSVVATYVQWRGAFMLLEILLLAVLAAKMLSRNLLYKMVTIKKKLA